MKVSGPLPVSVRVPDSWAPGVAASDANPAYIDCEGSLYDSRFNKIAEIVLDKVEFPKPEDFDEYEAFVNALSDWAKSVEKSLRGATLPVGLSRVWARPRNVEVDSTPSSSSAANSTTNLPSAVSSTGRGDEETGEDVSESTGETLLSPRLLSPRANRSGEVSSTSPSPSAPTSVDWRAVLVPPFPNLNKSGSLSVPSSPHEDTVNNNNAFLEAARRWAYLVMKQTSVIPPHPRDLAQLLGIKALGSSGSVETLDDAAMLVLKLSATTSNTTLSSSAAMPLHRLNTKPVWDRCIRAAELGLCGLEAPLKERRVALAAIALATNIRKKSAGSTVPSVPSIHAIPVRFRSASTGSAAQKGQTPILQRLKRVSNTAPNSPGMRERIAVIDMGSDDDSPDDFSSDDDDDDDTPTTSVAGDLSPGQKKPQFELESQLKENPVPTIVIGSSKATEMAKTRSAVLLGNVYVRRVQGALKRGEPFFRTPVYACIKPMILLPKYPELFIAHNDRKMIDVSNKTSILRLQSLTDDELAKTLTKAENKTGMKTSYTIPETELNQIDLPRFNRDTNYVAELNVKLDKMMLASKWDKSLSFFQSSATYVSYEDVEKALLDSLGSNGVMTGERVLSWLREEHFLDYWSQLLVKVVPTEVVLMSPQYGERKIAGNMATFGNILFDAVCHCLGDKTSVSGLGFLATLFNGTKNRAYKVCLAMFVVRNLPVFFARVLPNCSFQFLQFLCSCFQLCRVNAPDLLNVGSPAELGNILDVLSEGNADVSKFFLALYRDYFLEYMLQWKGSTEMPNECFIALQGVHASHVDLVRTMETSIQTDLVRVTSALLRHAARAPVVLGMHSAFVFCRIINRPVLLSLLLMGTDPKHNLLQMLFVLCTDSVKSKGAKMRMHCVLKALAQKPDVSKVVNMVYMDQINLFLGQMMTYKANIFSDSFLVNMVMSWVSQVPSMMYAAPSLKGACLTRKPTGHVLVALLDMLIQFQGKSMSVECRSRVLRVVHAIVTRCPDWNLLELPRDLTGMVSFAARYAGDVDTHMALDVLQVMTTRSPQHMCPMLKPDSSNLKPVIWKTLVDICRGDVAASSAENSRVVLVEVNRSAWFFVAAFLRQCPGAVESLISSRYLGALLACVAPHTPAGVAANALLALAFVVTVVPGEDIKQREREIKPLVAFMAEKSFLVQVHLLYRKQGADVPRNLHALSRWAAAALSSSACKDLLKEENQEYVQELTTLQSLVVDPSTPTTNKK